MDVTITPQHGRPCDFEGCRHPSRVLFTWHGSGNRVRTCQRHATGLRDLLYRNGQVRADHTRTRAQNPEPVYAGAGRAWVSAPTVTANPRRLPRLRARRPRPGARTLNA